MKICFLGDASEMHLKRWVRQFSMRGHETHVITFNPRPAADFQSYSGATLHLILKRRLGAGAVDRLRSAPVLLRDLRKLFADLTPDITHVHSAGGYAWMTALSGVRPYMVTPWGNDILIDVHRSRVNKILTSLALRRADAVHCDGENTRAALEQLGVATAKIHKVLFGTDVQLFRPMPIEPELRARLPFPDAPVILSIRTLTPVHGVEDLIRAIPLVLKEEPAARFVIVGDGPLRGELESLAAASGISAAIAFVGRVDELSMVRYLNIARVYVPTSHLESGLAGSTAEAMACQLPVINTDTGDIRRWIEEGRGGFIIPVSSPVDIADRIIRLLRDPEGAGEFGAANRAKIERENNVQIEMGKIEALYSALAGAPAASLPIRGSGPVDDTISATK